MTSLWDTRAAHYQCLAHAALAFVGPLFLSGGGLVLYGLWHAVAG